jgi:MoxR-like ATPase
LIEESMTEVLSGTAALELAGAFQKGVLAPIKQMFVGKDEVVDLLGISLVAGENLFILGPPGTAKSALVQELGNRLSGKTFEYLLTRFTEPNELFGPFDIRRLREGELVTNTEGMLPEASLAFLDELLNANSAILNSLLTALNERMFRRGREARHMPLLMVVGASNHLPEDDALRALFDRFLLRVHCDNVGENQLQSVLQAGRRIEALKLERSQRDGKGGPGSGEVKVSLEDARRLATAASTLVSLESVTPVMVGLIQRLRQAGIPISDRRAVKLQRPVAASALLSGRLEGQVSDLWVFRYIWETLEQRELLGSVVKETLEKAANEEKVHPRARQVDRPDPEVLAREAEQIEEAFAVAGISAGERARLKDRLGVLSGRIQWVAEETPRRFLQERVDKLLAAEGARK